MLPTAIQIPIHEVELILISVNTKKFKNLLYKRFLNRFCNTVGVDRHSNNLSTRSFCGPTKSHKYV